MQHVAIASGQQLGRLLPAACHHHHLLLLYYLGRSQHPGSESKAHYVLERHQRHGVTHHLSRCTTWLHRHWHHRPPSPSPSPCSSQSSRWPANFISLSKHRQPRIRKNGGNGGLDKALATRVCAVPNLAGRVSSSAGWRAEIYTAHDGLWFNSCLLNHSVTR